MPSEAIGPVRIRAATAGDAARMTDIVNRAFAIETFLEGPRTDVSRMTAAIQAYEFLVAEADNGGIVACVRIEQRDEHCRLGMLAVDPARQGDGLGRAMVEAAEERCRALGCEGVDVAVLSLRPDLLPFYRNLGYVETGEEPFRPARPLAQGVACHCIVLSRKV